MRAPIVSALVLAICSFALSARAETDAPRPASAPSPVAVAPPHGADALPHGADPQPRIADAPPHGANDRPSIAESPVVHAETTRGSRPVRGHLEATVDARRRVVLAFYDESGALRWRAVAWVSDAAAMLGTLSMLAGDSAEPDEEDEALASTAALAPAVPGPVLVAPAAPVRAPPVAAEPAPSHTVHIGVAERASAVRIAL